MTRDEVVAETRSWIGTPWHHQAAIKGIGCDCIGLLRGVAKSFDRPEAFASEYDIRFLGYGESPNPRLLIEACDSYLDRIAFADVLPGDIALARVEKEPQHFGIISATNPLYIIHSYRQVGCVTENIVDKNILAHILRMYRFRWIE